MISIDDLALYIKYKFGNDILTIDIDYNINTLKLIFNKKIIVIKIADKNKYINEIDVDQLHDLCQLYRIKYGMSVASIYLIFKNKMIRSCRCVAKSNNINICNFNYESVIKCIKKLINA